MAHGKDIVPRPDVEFDPFFNNICQYTGQKITAGLWTHIPAAENTKLDGAYTDWHTAYERTLKDHTKADTAAKDAARRKDEPVLRNFIQTWFRRFPDIVLAGDLAAMGIPPIDPTHSHIGRPKTRPVFRIVMNYRRASPAVSDFSMKNLSIERKFIYRRWFNTHSIYQAK